MANFTQLQLGNKGSQEPAKRENKFRFSKEKALFAAALLSIAVMSGVLLVITNGCSKGSKVASISSDQPSVTGPQNPASTATPSTSGASLPAPVDPKPAKKRVQRKAPMATYSDPTYGISFRYPKNYILKTSDTSKDEIAQGPVQTDFVEPGGTRVAALELPKTAYPGTDFTSGFFRVNVNSTLSQGQCEQFAFPKSEAANNEPSMPAKVKLGGNEYAMVENAGDSTTGEPHVKYFHRYENGNCYEFGMGLGTSDESVAGVKPVNRSLVFGRLERILASVKVNPPVASEVATDSQGHPMVEGSKQ